MVSSPVLATSASVPARLIAAPLAPGPAWTVCTIARRCRPGELDHRDLIVQLDIGRRVQALRRRHQRETAAPGDRHRRRRADHARRDGDGRERLRRSAAHVDDRHRVRRACLLALVRGGAACRHWRRRRSGPVVRGARQQQRGDDQAGCGLHGLPFFGFQVRMRTMLRSSPGSRPRRRRPSRFEVKPLKPQAPTPPAPVVLPL